MSSKQIRVRVESGRLHPIFAGVYLVGHKVPARYAMESAVVLVFRRDAVLSHASAASLWGLTPYPPRGPVCVTVPPGKARDRDGIRVHRAELTRRDIRSTYGLPVTSPPRTLLDLSSSLEEGELESLVAEAEYRRLARRSELQDQLTRNPRKRGARVLRRVLGLPGGPQRTRSGGERAFLRLLRREGIAGFEANARVAGYEVDFLFRDANLVVEIDGYDGHSGRVAFERDRLKGARLTAAGLSVMHVTGRQVNDDPAGVIQRLRAALGVS